MARQGKGILGAPSKSVGMITGQKHSGKDTIRSKPKSSIKTQTPELLKTKSNFQIASEFWDIYQASNWSKLIEKPTAAKTTRNHFIGEFLKLLNAKENGFFQFNPFPKTYPYLKFNASASFTGIQPNWKITWGYQPYPIKSKATDYRFTITYSEYQDRLLISNRNSATRRGDGLRSFNNAWSWLPGDRRIFAVFFVSEDYSEISNGIAITGTR